MLYYNVYIYMCFFPKREPEDGLNILQKRNFRPGGRRKVRTAADPPMPPDEALKMLKEGNRRFVKGEPQAA